MALFEPRLDVGLRSDPAVAAGADGSIIAILKGTLAAIAAWVAGGSSVTVDNTTASAVLTQEDAVTMLAVDTSAGADNTAVTITYAGAAARRHCISGVAWSYDADPTGGKLTIADNGTTVFEIDITKSGPGFVPFPRPKRSALVNTALVITLAAGGGTVEGCLSILDHWTE